MRIKIIFMAAFMCAAMIFSGCSKDDGFDGRYQFGFRKIYVGGTYFDPGTGREKPCYWVNGMMTALPCPADVFQSFVVWGGVSDGRVYFAGYYADRKYFHACYWVDGEYHTLDMPAVTENSGGAVVSSATFDGDDFYVAGYYEQGHNREACYWLNGTYMALEAPDTNMACADKIVVASGKVYIIGRYRKQHYEVPCYWIDGVFHEIPVDGNLQFDNMSMELVNGKICMFGTCDRTDIYGSQVYAWIDGTYYELPNPENAIYVICRSMDIYKGKAYVLGYYAEGVDADNVDILRTCYWVDGVLYDLGGSKGLKFSGSSIMACEGGIYMTGYYEKMGRMYDACCMLNGVKKHLVILPGVEHSVATCIAVGEED